MPKMSDHIYQLRWDRVEQNKLQILRDLAHNILFIAHSEITVGPAAL